MPLKRLKWDNNVKLGLTILIRCNSIPDAGLPQTNGVARTIPCPTCSEIRPAGCLVRFERPRPLQGLFGLGIPVARAQRVGDEPPGSGLG